MLGLGLGLGLTGGITGSSNIIFDQTKLSDLTVSRSSDLLYIDSSRKYANVSGDVAVLEYDFFNGAVKGVPSFPTVTCKNLYMRPSTGVVGDHFTSGTANITIVDDATNPFSNLTNGEKVWRIDNSGGGMTLSVGVAGAVDTTSGRFSMQMWARVDSGYVDITLDSGDNERTNSEDWVHVYGENLAPNNVADEIEIEVAAGTIAHVTGINLQNLKYITNPIDTAGTELTRTQDKITMPASFYNSTEGTFIYEMWDQSRGETIGDWVTLLSISETGSNDDSIQLINRNSSTEYRLFVYDEDSLELNVNNPITINRFIQKFGVKFNSGGTFELFQNGASIGTDTGDTPTDIDTVHFMHDAEDGFNHAIGWIRELRWYDEALEDAEINALTTEDDLELNVVFGGQSNVAKAFEDFTSSAVLEKELREGGYLNVNLINGAIGASGMHVDAAGGGGYWYDPDTNTKGGAYTNMLTQIDAAVESRSHIDLMLWQQGENDAVFIADATITQAQFRSALNECFAAFRVDLSSDLPIYIAMLPRDTNSGDEVGYQSVKDEYLDYIVDNSNSEFLSENYDQPQFENVHLTQAGSEVIFSRYAQRALALLGKRSAVGTIGPQVVEADADGSSIYLQIDHDNGNSLMVPNGAEDMFRVEDTVGVMTINDVTTSKESPFYFSVQLAQISPTTIQLVMSRAVVGAFTVQVAYGSMPDLDGTDPEVVVDNAAPSMPLRGVTLNGT